MNDFVDEAEGRLRAEGYRVTRARRQVIAILASADRALSPYALLEALVEQRPDVVTVYRILELLEHLGLVHRVHSLNGYVACTRLAGGGCHHPLICIRCGRIAECQGEGLHELEARLAGDGWEVTGHVLEIQGVCPSCRAQDEAVA